MILNIFLGVEDIKTDMEEHKVIVTGKVDPAAIVKEIKKKNGKKAEIIGVVDSGSTQKESSDED